MLVMLWLTTRYSSSLLAPALLQNRSSNLLSTRRCFTSLRYTFVPIAAISVLYRRHRHLSWSYLNSAKISKGGKAVFLHGLFGKKLPSRIRGWSLQYKSSFGDTPTFGSYFSVVRSWSELLGWRLLCHKSYPMSIRHRLVRPSWQVLPSAWLAHRNLYIQSIISSARTPRRSWSGGTDCKSQLPPRRLLISMKTLFVPCNLCPTDSIAHRPFLRFCRVLAI
jgi:hypothetical protein